MTNLTPYEALRSTQLAAELTEDQCRVLAGLVTLRDLKPGEKDLRTNRVVSDKYADWTTHANNPMRTAESA